MPSKALRPEDILVEFRDRDLVRRGAIPISDLRLKFQPVYNNVGAWILSLPAEHRAVPYLRAPGAGIVITNLQTDEVMMSGSTSKPSKKATSIDPVGMVSIAGLDDNRLAFDARAFPSPSEPDVAAQTTSHDVRTGVGSTIMRECVNANIGPGAPVARVGSSLRSAIVLGDDPVFGLTTTQRARYDNLGELLNKTAAESGGVGWRFVQVGNTIEFQTYEPVDRSALIRLDVVNGTLQETSVEFAPPELTRSIVAGQGEGVERQFIQVTTAESTEAEDQWGLIIEDFKDQRQTDVEDELEQAGLGDLSERGFTKVAIKAVPSNDQTMIFLTDFFLGDRVAVVIDGQEQPNSSITEAAIVIDETGMRTAVAIGDINDFDSDSALRQTVTDNTRRISQIERNIELPKTTYGQDSLWLDGLVLKTMRGTTAERDAVFGTPSTDAARAALANRKVTWWNTDLGWEESYYATTGLSGLTARGLVAGIDHGWYPVGEGPEGVLYSAGSQAFSGAGNFTNWRDWGTGSIEALKSWKNTDGNTSGSIIHRAASNAALQVFLAGRWSVSVSMTYPNGSGTAVGSLRVNTGGVDRTRQVPIPLLSGYGQIVDLQFKSVLITSGGYAFFRNDAGTLSMGSSVEDNLAVKYLGPPLVSA